MDTSVDERAGQVSDRCVFARRNDLMAHECPNRRFEDGLVGYDQGGDFSESIHRGRGVEIGDAIIDLFVALVDLEDVGDRDDTRERTILVDDGGGRLYRDDGTAHNV